MNKHSWIEFVVQCNCGNILDAKLDIKTKCSNCESDVLVRLLNDGTYQPMVYSSRKLERTMKMKLLRSEIVSFVS